MAGWGEVLSWALVRERKEGQVRGTWTLSVVGWSGKGFGGGGYLKKSLGIRAAAAEVGGLNHPHRVRTTLAILKRLRLADIPTPSCARRIP